MMDNGNKFVNILDVFTVRNEVVMTTVSITDIYLYTYARNPFKKQINSFETSPF